MAIALIRECAGFMRFSGPRDAQNRPVPIGEACLRHALSALRSPPLWHQRSRPSTTVGQCAGTGPSVLNRRLGWGAAWSRAPRRHRYPKLYQRFPGQCVWRNQERHGWDRDLPTTNRPRLAKASGVARRPSPYPRAPHPWSVLQCSGYWYILAVSNLEAGPVTRLYALWYEHNAPGDRWSVRAGLMLADSQFVQSETASIFVN